jgi:hypothetical protein
MKKAVIFVAGIQNQFAAIRLAAVRKFSGADGIVQVEVVLPKASAAGSKGALFQAKKNNICRDRILIKQIQSMEGLASPWLARPSNGVVPTTKIGDRRAASVSASIEHFRNRL